MTRLLSVLLIVGTLLLGCGPTTSANTEQSPSTPPQAEQVVYDAQLAEFTKQQEETAKQLAESARQMSKQSDLLAASAALLERQQALLAKQEQQAKRYDAILERWERQAAR